MDSLNADSSDVPGEAPPLQQFFEPVLQLQFSRSPEAFDATLSEGPELEPVRSALEQRGYAWRLPGGAKVFVLPEQYLMVKAILRQYALRPCHVIVSEALEPFVHEALHRLPSRLNVHLRQATQLAYLREEEVVLVERLRVPNTRMLSSQSVVQSTAEVHRARNPRRRVVQ
eukprot:gnl/MRDRNA2_/MRDRNA2_79518_c0_seq1.p2 gnl/MRDRNA2_/MRDRNA2_79518_c0~~gnl/MRDRNA2_/MRDRNA2_79518_c0_seq1.p2  ORF type:complete len:171 (-),score=24.33 gnl/MRDRNA2_/MRDRNA2_79518_c0_seq1:74-586(-)